MLNCPEYDSEYSYEDGIAFVCPECAHELLPNEVGEAVVEDAAIKDANGNVSQDWDTITVTKDLKVKGSSLVVKAGTKAKQAKPRYAALQASGASRPPKLSISRPITIGPTMPPPNPQSEKTASAAPRLSASACMTTPPERVAVSPNVVTP